MSKFDITSSITTDVSHFMHIFFFQLTSFLSFEFWTLFLRRSFFMISLFIIWFMKNACFAPTYRFLKRHVFFKSRVNGFFKCFSYKITVTLEKLVLKTFHKIFIWKKFMILILDNICFLLTTENSITLKVILWKSDIRVSINIELRKHSICNDKINASWF